MNAPRPLRCTVLAVLLGLVALPAIAQVTSDPEEFQRRREAIRQKYRQAAAAGDVEGKRAAVVELRALRLVPRPKTPPPPPKDRIQGRPAVNTATTIDNWVWDHLLDPILPKPQGNEDNRSGAIRISGGVVIPGIEVGVPGSFFLEGGEEVSVQRNADGTVEVTIKDEGALGLEENLAEAKGKVKIGKEEYGLGFSANARVGLRGIRERKFKFDPTQEDEAKKLFGLLASEGVATGTGLGFLASALQDYVLSDNLESQKVQFGPTASAEGKVQAVIDLVSAKVNGDLLGGIEVRKGEDGKQEIVPSLMLKIGGEGGIPILGGRFEGTAELKPIYDAQTGELKRVELEVATQGGGVVGTQAFLEAMKEELGLGMVSGVGGDAGLKATFALDKPGDVLGNLLANPTSAGLNQFIEQVRQNGEFELFRTLRAETGIGAGGKIGVATQAIGVDGQLTLSQTIEERIYPPKGGGGN
ncbi:MAG: hypothetical protein HY720_13225 [Planctomycetes bacterium]|nr:hypothetical protein [Planctomycetota bacterium]